MGFKNKVQKSDNGPKIDWEFINDQMDEDTYDAVVAAVIDLGIHEQAMRVNFERVTYVATEDEAIELINIAEENSNPRDFSNADADAIEEEGDIYVLPFRFGGKDDSMVFFKTEEEPNNITYVETEKKAKAFQRKAEKNRKSWQKDSNLDYEVIEDALMLNFELYRPKDCSEVGFLADLTDTEIEYVEGEEPRNYRVNLCHVWKGELTGYAIRGGKYRSNSMLSKLAKATGFPEVVDDEDDDFLCFEKLAGGKYYQAIEKTKKGFVKTGDPAKPRAKDVGSIPPLGIEGYEDGVVIMFEGPEEIEDRDERVAELVNRLKAIKLNKLFVEKIKSALNYEDSEIEEAFKILESGSSDSKEEKKTESKTKRKVKRKEEEPEEPEEKEEEQEEEPEEKPKKRRTTRKRTAAKEEPEPEEEEKEEEPEEEEKPTKARKRRTTRKTKEEPEPDEDEGEEDDDEDSIPW